MKIPHVPKSNQPQNGPLAPDLSVGAGRIPSESRDELRRDRARSGPGEAEIYDGDLPKNIAKAQAPSADKGPEELRIIPKGAGGDTRLAIRDERLALVRKAREVGASTAREIGPQEGRNLPGWLGLIPYVASLYGAPVAMMAGACIFIGACFGGPLVPMLATAAGCFGGAAILSFASEKIAHKGIQLPWGLGFIKPVKSLVFFDHKPKNIKKNQQEEAEALHNRAKDKAYEEEIAGFYKKRGFKVSEDEADQITAVLVARKSASAKGKGRSGGGGGGGTDVTPSRHENREQAESRGGHQGEFRDPNTGGSQGD